jgi:hypothetical protein
VTVALVAAGAVISFVAVRQLPPPVNAADEALVPALAAELSGSAEPEIAAEPGGQPAWETASR